ncbi:thiamine phosphate synthase [Cohaesibacter celericrescens]|uniref:Thiamine phosphate synthase n=1 Tax=Cohaesibacter celericrescens TaxID=2067669 RepID=A0A2N5XL60_9HYPH|nr:thiamine phosphate synthase [Cohaesibacter celericrescens]PLW75232.1 thiamine phosphate synthase [Cohaesibacter celericrescens]
MEPCQIYLVTPRHIDLESFPAQLAAAIDGGNIAALLIDCDAEHDTELQLIAQTIAPMAQKKDIAVVLRGDSRIAGRTKCDGLHLNGDLPEIASGVEDYSDRFMLGAEGGNKRHSAMEIGESGIDYIMFGRLDAPTTPIIHDKSFEMADWWSGLFEVPTVIISGSDLSECSRVGATNIEFIALREAIWDHEEGPKTAVQKACALLHQAAHSTR